MAGNQGDVVSNTDAPCIPQLCGITQPFSQPPAPWLSDGLITWCMFFTINAQHIAWHTDTSICRMTESDIWKYSRVELYNFTLAFCCDCYASWLEQEVYLAVAGSQNCLYHILFTEKQLLKQINEKNLEADLEWTFLRNRILTLTFLIICVFV